MICSRCASRLSRTTRVTTLARRGISTSAPAAAEATSTSSAAQPFTTPDNVSPGLRGEVPSSKKVSDSPIVLSSCPAGTPLRGLNFIKGKVDPVAMEDQEYPAWLWDVLKPKKKQGDDAVDTDIFSKSKNKRAKAKRAMKNRAGQEEIMEKVPLYEQTIDLPSGDGTEAGALEAARARQDLTKAMREKRRSTIKEANFLRTMR